MDFTSVLSQEEMKNIAMSLFGFISKGTATAVNTKIKTIRAEDDIEKRSRQYEEIITELISEREETLRIAQIYKSELERITISDEDIKHLNITVSNVIDLFKGNGQEENSNIQAAEMFKNLISADTLKTMQLLGFNYKAAIGEPLTQVCAEKVLSLG